MVERAPQGLQMCPEKQRLKHATILTLNIAETKIDYEVLHVGICRRG